MKKLNIPKKSGGTRAIYIQGPTEKHRFRLLGHEMDQFYQKNEAKAAVPVAHGFVRGRSPVSNASQHLGKQFTLTMDLKDFFDTVTVKHLIKAGVNENTAKAVCYEGATRQGLSSSPASANVAAIPLDTEILLIVKPGTVYTRCADDLNFSSDNLSDLLFLRDEVPRLVEKCEFKVNNKKTRIQSAKFGRRIITGIAVDNAIYPTKKHRRNLRAAKHNITKLLSLLSFLLWVDKLLIFALILEVNRKTISKYVGLREWCKLKPPTRSIDGKCFSAYVKVKTEDAFAGFGN